MKIQTEAFLPEARIKGLITKNVDGELLVYDRERDLAHCLNATATRIWELSDGKTTTSEIARTLVQSRKSKVQSYEPEPSLLAAGQPPVAPVEHLVWLGLKELQRKRLLKSEDRLPPEHFVVTKGITRREAVRRLATAAAIAIPIVATITVPTSAQAGTCKHANATCSANPDCCSGTCMPGAPPKCLGG